MRWDDHDKKKLSLINEILRSHLKGIKELYNSFIKEIMFDLSDMYVRLEKDGTLTYQDVKKYRDLDRFQKRIIAQANVLEKNTQKKMHQLLEETYDLSYSYMSYAVENEMDVLLKKSTPHLPEILAKANANPVYGLKLDPALEKNRAIIVKNINSGIERGLKNGDTYGGIAREIQKEFDSSYGRAVRIAQTEVHRVREQASHESAMNAHGQGVKMKKFWRNMADERVRKRKQADHRGMEGQERTADKPFNLIPEGTADSPGNSGIASQDINCRCYASYRVDYLESQVTKEAVDSTFKDWKKAKEG